MIEPNILQPNLIPIELEDINIQGGMDISATPLANTPITTTPSNIVVSPNGSVINLGSLQSTNFKVGTTGWKLGADGIIRAVGVILSGDIKATTGKIGAFTINATSIYTGTEDHSGYTANAGDLTIYSDGTDASIHAKNFYIDASGNITGTGVTLTGALTTGAGSAIDGQYIGALSIVAGSIANNTITSGQIAALTITASEIANNTITAGQITASTITTSEISGTAGIVGGQIANLTIAAGNITNLTITAAQIANATITGGKVVQNTITGGATGNIALTSIVAGNIAAATITGTQIAATTIAAGNIAANTITADQIATGTITATQITGTTLSAIYADLGTITAGNITLDSSGYIKGGQTAYNTGTGFFLGYDTDAYKLSVGVSTGYHLNFDGTDLDIVAKSITTGDKTITVSTSDNVQTAINDINSAGGGTVFLQSGTYTLTADLVLYSNITLMGTDPDRCIIDFNGGAYQVKVIGTVGTRKTDILIKNLTIKNSELSDPTYATDYYTIKIDYVDEIMFDNCIIYDTTLDDASREQYLIAVYRCNKIVVENCYFYSNTTASYGIGIISSSGELIVRNSKFEDFGQSANGIAGYGIILWTNGSLDNCIISENTFEDCYNYSVYLQGTTPFVSFINNVCKRTGEAVAGVFTDASAEGSILGNYFKSLTGDGINVNAGEHIIISNNIAVGCNRGVKVSGDNTIIANNIIKDGASHGIEIIGGSDNNIISNNIITNQGGYGVKIETSACDKNIIIANQLVGNTSGAIQDTGTNTEIGHNIES